MVASRKAIPIRSGLDLKDPELYTSDDCHGVFARLRAGEPVYWNPEADSTGFWAVTRYEDVVRVVQDPETFSAAVENGGMRIFNKHEVTVDPKPHLLAMDPPRHTQLRRALQPLFTPQVVATLESRVRARMTRLIDAIAQAGTVEFVSSIAAPLTLGLLADLIAVPESDSAKLLEWSNALIGDDDPDYHATIESRPQSLAEIDEYAARLLAERRKSPGMDLVSLLATAQLDGQPLDFGSYSENFAMFLIAGNETTRHSLSAGVLALSLFPAEKEKLLGQRSLLASAIKEIVRWASPVMHVRRTATRDTEIAGRSIRRGDKVVVWYNSANRDSCKWANPMTFEVGRFESDSATPHLAFGSGPHYCLGWRMAELQLRVALEEMLDRLPDFHVTGPVRRLRSNFVGGIKELPVAFTPTASREPELFGK
jgi:linalool 8-monooxygenase